MGTLVIVVLLNYVGIPFEVAKIIGFILYCIYGIIIIAALLSIINTNTYTKRNNEQIEQIVLQNAQLISQNQKLIQQLETIAQQQYTGNKNQYEYAKYMSRQTQARKDYTPNKE